MKPSHCLPVARQAFKAQEVQSLEARLFECLEKALGPGPCAGGTPGYQLPARARIKGSGGAAQGAATGKRSRLTSGGAPKPSSKADLLEGCSRAQASDERCVLHENGLVDDSGPDAIATAHESESAAAALREAGLERLERYRAEDALQEVSRVVEQLRGRLQAAEREAARLGEAAALHERAAAEAASQQSSTRLELQHLQVGRHVALALLMLALSRRSRNIQQTSGAACGGNHEIICNGSPALKMESGKTL